MEVLRIGVYEWIESRVFDEDQRSFCSQCFVLVVRSTVVGFLVFVLSFSSRGLH